MVTATGWSMGDSPPNEQPETEVKPMKTLATLINVTAFTALFVAYASVASAERPTGVRRALQTYSGQVYTGAYPTLKPFCKNDVNAARVI